MSAGDTNINEMELKEEGERNGYRVKLYVLQSDGAGYWQDQGTGNVVCHVPVLGEREPAIVVFTETPADDSAGTPSTTNVLLRSKIQADDVYERQGESIIMWREVDEFTGGDCDYALSFQDTAGCLTIWKTIVSVQDGSLMRANSNNNEYMSASSSLSALPYTANSNGFHDSSDMNVGVGSGGRNVNNGLNGSSNSHTQEGNSGGVHVLPIMSVANLHEIREKLWHLCNPSSLSSSSSSSSLYYQSGHIPSLRESYISQVLHNDAEFLRRLVTVFSDLEDLDDADGLIKAAEICRAVLLLNDSGILERTVMCEDDFVNIAGVMEYDPALKTRAGSDGGSRVVVVAIALSPITFRTPFEPPFILPLILPLVHTLTHKHIISHSFFSTMFRIPCLSHQQSSSHRGHTHVLWIAQTIHPSVVSTEIPP